jgi:SNF2 family DNA or RNA helicase
MGKLLKTKLYSFQRKAVKFAIKQGSVALFMEQGTGKTITVLAIAARLWRRNLVRNVLIVAPKAVLIGWERQARQHLNIPVRIYVGKDGAAVAKREIAEEYTGITILVVNYELLWRRPWIQEFYHWSIVVADESHRIKKHDAKQSLACASIKAEYYFALTGTPTDGDELHLWSQFRFVNSALLGKNYKNFCEEYCWKQTFGEGAMPWQFKWVLNKKKRRRMLKILKPHTFRISKNQALDLPPTLDQAIYFKLTGKALTAYQEMEVAYYTEFEDQDATTELTITNMLRLQQLTGGHLVLDEGGTVRLEQDKLIALLDFLEDIPKKKKIVIFVKFTDEINILKEAMEKTHRSVDVLDGRTKDQGKTWTDFQDKENPRVIICQVQKGIGIELFRSNLAIFYSNSFSWIDYDQNLKRLDRHGQLKKITYIHMLSDNTIDEDIYNSLKRKGSSAEEILNHMESRRHKMAKDNKKKRTPPKIEKPTHGVDQLAEALGVDPATARVKLRSVPALKKEYKTGRAWNFESAANVKAVAKQLSTKKTNKK